MKEKFKASYLPASLLANVHVLEVEGVIHLKEDMGKNMDQKNFVGDQPRQLLDGLTKLSLDTLTRIYQALCVLGSEEITLTHTKTSTNYWKPSTVTHDYGHASFSIETSKIESELP
jgi:hypothetical protein